MTNEDPRLTLLKRLDFKNLDSCAELFTEDFVWHYFNPRLPQLAGDYHGVGGLKSFFESLGAFTKGTFVRQTISVTPWGDELLVMCNKNRLTLQGTAIETDVVLVWRFVDGRLAEVWDIPSAYSGTREQPPGQLAPDQ